MCDNIVVFMLFYHKLTRREEIKFPRQSVTTKKERCDKEGNGTLIFIVIENTRGRISEWDF